MRKVLVLLSGGLDSTIVAKHYLLKKYEVTGLYFDYFQPHREMEFEALKGVARELNIDWYPILLTDYYCQLSLDEFFVPMRNALFLCYAIHKAYFMGIKNVAYGACHGEYLDVTPEFVDRFNFMQDYCLKKPIYVLAPFAHWSKERLLKYGLKIGAPLELTYSCMQVPPCGKCLPCRLRKKYGIDGRI